MPDRRNDMGGLFRRDLDRIELPPRDTWRPTPRKESYLVKTSRVVLYAGVVAAVLVAALIVGFGLRDRNSQVASPPSPLPTTSTPVPASSPPATPSPNPTSSPAPTPSPSPVGGAITGRLSYPSDFIPPVTVYAIGADDQRIWFSVEFPGYGNPPRPTAQPGTEPGTYTLPGVAPGRYQVVAYRNDGQKPDPGLHTREAQCLRRTPSGPCPDQSPIAVTVTAGQTTREIDIVTWWPGSGLMAPPPPRPVQVCGPLTRFDEPGGNVGRLVVGPHEFTFSREATRSTPTGTTTLGANVCLTGRWLYTQPVGRELLDFRLAFQ